MNDNYFDNEEIIGDIVDDIFDEEDTTTMDLGDFTDGINNKSDDAKKSNNKEKVNTYKRLHSLYAQVCDQVQNQDEFEIVRRKLQEAHSELIQMNAKNSKNSKNTSSVGIASFPIVDRQKKIND